MTLAGIGGMSIRYIFGQSFLATEHWCMVDNLIPIFSNRDYYIFQALIVFEYLVAHGSERVIDDLKEHAYQLSVCYIVKQ
jgi:hypothetical protein